jgi:Bacterial Ig domain
VWQGTQKLSQVLAIFRDRYTPKAGSAIIDAGDPSDNDSKGRRTDIGAIDLDGHDQDQLGKFGTPPSELVPPTVTLTAPTAGAELTGVTTLSATATDNPGGSGVVLVQFLVDGATVGQTAQSPYSVSFNTATLMNGDHAFSAKAFDGAGNSAVSAVVTAHTTNAMVVSPDGGAGAGGSAGTAGAGGTSQGGTIGGGAPNGGVPNAGAPNAGAANGGTPTGASGNPGADGGTSGETDSSGCMCRAASERERAPASMLALGAALTAVCLRRRRRMSSA